LQALRTRYSRELAQAGTLWAFKELPCVSSQPRWTWREQTKTSLSSVKESNSFFVFRVSPALGKPKAAPGFTGKQMKGKGKGKQGASDRRKKGKQRELQECLRVGMDQAAERLHRTRSDKKKLEAIYGGRAWMYGEYEGIWYLAMMTAKEGFGGPLSVKY